MPTPPAQSPLAHRYESNDFSLPAPAMQAPEPPDLPHRTGTMKRNLTRLPLQRRASEAITPAATTAEEYRAAALHRRPSHWGTIASSPSQLRRMLSQAHTARKGDMSRSESVLSDFDLVREREREFHEFMESELEKVETFYKTKEDQAGQRLSVLREQLHEMRNRRIQELCASDDNDHDGNSNTEIEHSHDGLNGWVQPIKARIFPPGPNSKALRNMPTTPFLPASSSAGDATRDYSRRRQQEDVSYRTAKRKLKLALQEFYRGLELLKSYAMLNRTAFRKLNKKFDKAANARPPQRFMSEKVNKAWFVNSELVDGHIRAVEDLYARYFERGNHKIAVSKLRSLSKKTTDESGSSFLNGFLIGTGLIFTVQGLIYGVELLHDSDPVMRANTSYVMQLYGGFFLMLLMFAFFCIDCFIWTRNKINYPFIFEFDQRHHIDWRRLSEFPSFFLLLLGIFMWMNFSRYGADWLYTYYPAFLISICAAIIFFPAPVMAHKSRQWLIYAHVSSLTLQFRSIVAYHFLSGDSSWLGFTPSSFVTFSLATCIVRLHTPWRYVLHHCDRTLLMIVPECRAILLPICP